MGVADLSTFTTEDDNDESFVQVISSGQRPLTKMKRKLDRAQAVASGERPVIFRKRGRKQASTSSTSSSAMTRFVTACDEGDFS